MENNNISQAKAFFSYLINPKIKFETHEPNEKILLLIRSHPFTQLYWVVNSIFFLIIPIVVDPFIFNLFSYLQLLFINIFAIAFILSYLWFNFLNWYFNVGIITNRRVVDIDYSGVLYKEITVARLDRIEDITTKSGGYFEAFFDFGTIFIQTAGTEANVEFIDVPHPSEVVKAINKLLTRKHGN